MPNFGYRGSDLPPARTLTIGVQINDTDPDKLRAAIEYTIRIAFFEGFESAHPPTGPEWDREKFNEWCQLNFEDYQRTAAYESLINSAIARIR